VSGVAVLEKSEEEPTSKLFLEQPICSTCSAVIKRKVKVRELLDLPPKAPERALIRVDSLESRFEEFLDLFIPYK